MIKNSFLVPIDQILQSQEMKNQCRVFKYINPLFIIKSLKHFVAGFNSILSTTDRTNIIIYIQERVWGMIHL